MFSSTHCSSVFTTLGLDCEKGIYTFSSRKLLLSKMVPVVKRLIIVYIVRIQDPNLKVKPWSINWVWWCVIKLSDMLSIVALPPHNNAQRKRSLRWQFGRYIGGPLLSHWGHPQGCFRRFNVKLTQLVDRQTLQELPIICQHFSERLPRNVLQCHGQDQKKTKTNWSCRLVV